MTCLGVEVSKQDDRIVASCLFYKLNYFEELTFTEFGVELCVCVQVYACYCMYTSASTHMCVVQRYDTRWSPYLAQHYPFSGKHFSILELRHSASYRVGVGVSSHYRVLGEDTQTTSNNTAVCVFVLTKKTTTMSVTNIKRKHQYTIIPVEVMCKW